MHNKKQLLMLFMILYEAANIYLVILFMFKIIKEYVFEE